MNKAQVQLTKNKIAKEKNKIGKTGRGVEN